MEGASCGGTVVVVVVAARWWRHDCGGRTAAESWRQRHPRCKLLQMLIFQVLESDRIRVRPRTFFLANQSNIHLDKLFTYLTYAS